MAKRGKRLSQQGVVVLDPEFGNKNFRIIGVGFDSIGAIRDANWRDNQCRVPDARYFDENPQWVLAKCRLAVHVSAADIAEGMQKRDAANSLRQKAV